MFRILLGVIVFVVVTSGAAWFTLKRDDIPYEALETTYASYASDYIDLPNGVRMHFRDEGPRDSDKILVLVHGYASSLHTWEPWVHRLENEYRIISLDLPVHGLTRAPDDFEPTIEAFAENVKHLADALDIDEFVLGGSSMGGNIAWSYALAHPQDLVGLTLVAAAGWPETDAEMEDDPLLLQLAGNPLIGPILTQIDTTDQIRSGLQASYVDQDFVTDGLVRRYSELSRAPGHRQGLFDIMMIERTPATAEALSAISIPTLILHGDQDNLVPVRGARLFEKAIARSTLVVYEDVGHMPQEEVADQSAEDFLAFLQQVYPSTEDAETRTEAD
ncbi:MAG: alpha/beta hydrolase [Pseudomonadota bacterium]